MSRTVHLASLLALAGLSLAGAGSIAGCLGTETGNPPFSPDVGYAGVPPQGISPDPTVDSARVRMDEVSAVDCDGARVPMLRQVTIDFTTGEASVGEALEIPAGIYCGLEVVAGPCTDPDLCRTAAPDAIAVGATRRVDAADVQIRDVETTVVTLEGEPFELGPDAGGVLIVLQLESLVAGLQIGTAVTSPDGVVRIDADNNADRLPAVRTGLRDGLRLVRDTDADGMLDPEEAAAPLAQAPAPAP